jgi:hypothetical protein
VRKCVHTCVVLFIQQATHIHRTLTSFVASLALPHFSTLSHKRHDFGEKVIDYEMYILIFSTTFVWEISHSKKN